MCVSGLMHWRKLFDCVGRVVIEKTKRSYVAKMEIDASRDEVLFIGESQHRAKVVRVEP